MSQLLTKFFLRQRYWGATIAIVLCLVAAIGIAGYELHESRTRAPFINAISTLVKTANRFEVQIAWAITDATRGHIDKRIQKQLTQTYSELTSLFIALCLAENEVEKHEIHSQDNIGLPWRILVHDIGGNIHASELTAQLHKQSMPASLTKLWHTPQPPNKRNLEDQIADLLLKGHSIVKAKGVYTPEHFAQAEAIEALSSTELAVALDNILRILDKAAERESMRAFYILLGCCIAGICIALLNAILVFSPMEQTILATQKQLVGERDRALTSEHAKRDFLAVMSHELRTPMNGILGFTNLLLSTDLSEKQKDYAETIQTSGEILLTLLNDILDVSRIEAGAFELEKEDFSIFDTVSNVVTLLGPRAFAKRLDLSAFVDPALPEKLSGDSGRLRQILLNLVGNAIKFTMSGGIAIEVRYLGRKPENRHEIMISVTDTGIGIPKEERTKIFDYFTQVDVSASRKFEGTGLGLAICQKIVELMDGQIGVESAADHGSTFFVQIELDGVIPPAEQIAAKQTVNIEGTRILVVDDNALNRRIFRLQLEAFGAIVTCLPSAHSAMVTLEQSNPTGRGVEVAIIDQMMPEIDGLTLLSMIRENPRYNQMKTIISSSAGITHDQEARLLGFDAALPKPVMQDRLLQTIYTLISQQDVSEEHQSEQITDNADIQNQAAGVTDAADGEETPPTEPDPNDKPRILLAEDNTANQHLIIAMLETAGYSVDVVADGIEAVHAAQKLPYDLILMDIRMPVMGGVEAIQRIRAAHTQSATCPVIAMTANAMAGDQEEYLAAGMTDYISKPVDLRLLMEKMQIYLGEHSVSATPPETQADANAGANAKPAANVNTETVADSTNAPRAKAG